MNTSLRIAVAASLALSLAACGDRKDEGKPTCGASDTPPCAVGTGGAPHDSGGAPEQQK